MRVRQSCSSTGRDYASTNGGSVVADDAEAHNALNTGSDDEDDAVDLHADKKTFREVLFATVYTLTKDGAFDTSVKVAALRIVIEFWQVFLVLFNSNLQWQINKSLWIYKYIQWLMFKNIVAVEGYNAYIVGLYSMWAIVIAGTVSFLAIGVMRVRSTSQSRWLKRLISMAQLLAMTVCMMYWPAIMDYTAAIWNCQWSNLAAQQAPMHILFPQRSCLAMPHLAHVIFAAIMTGPYVALVLLLAMARCEGNPRTTTILALSDSLTAVKIEALKSILVAISSALNRYRNVQIVIMLLAVAGIFYLHIINLPYYSSSINLIYTGMWSGMLLVMCLLSGLHFSSSQHADNPEFAQSLTWAVLYGIVPAILLGVAVCWARMRLIHKRSAIVQKAFERCKSANVNNSTPAEQRCTRATNDEATALALSGDLRKVYRFKDVTQVSLFLRGMRKWDKYGEADDDAAQFGEFVLKCAMARMPNNPTLLAMYASFLIEVHKDGQAATVQLQLAQRSGPSFLETFSIHAAHQTAKQLAQKRDGDSMGLLGYIEFQRNYRACVRAHQKALKAQQHFWTSLLSDTVSFQDMQEKLELMAATEQRATMVYRRVLERYPRNGKILRTYAHFVEFVRNEPWHAAKYYGEAQKQGTSESILAMLSGQGSTEVLTAALGSSIDDKADALVIINAQGNILTMNTAALDMFGYEKGQLEGKNVSVLMPQPFSSKHNGFLQRYTSTGEAHIADKARSMVALHKDRSLFPVTLCVTRLSGSSNDMLFMGVMRKPPPATSHGNTVVRFWTTSTGIVLCCDQTVSDSFGLEAGSIAGQLFSGLCTDAGRVKDFLSLAISQASQGAAATEGCKLMTHVLHKFLPPVPVELSISFGGSTDGSSDCRMVCIQACVLAEACAMLVVDHKARIMYATDNLSTMLSYPMASLLKMELSSLLPQPYCQLHSAWFKDLSQQPRLNSCRTGGVMHLLSSNGAKLPVTLKISTQQDAISSKPIHVVQVKNMSASDQWNRKRLLLDVNQKGIILQVNAGASKSVFGFEPSELVGKPLAAAVDIFGYWRLKFGEDESLLSLLVTQALTYQTQPSSTRMFGSNHGGSGGVAWRVGVHAPCKTDADIVSDAARLAAEDHQSEKAPTCGISNNLLKSKKQGSKLHASCMTVELLQQQEAVALSDDDSTETTAVLQVSLFRANALTAMVELDKQLNVTHVEEAVGLIFGVESRRLLHANINRVLGLPETNSFQDLLGNNEAPHKASKGALKTGRLSGVGGLQMGRVQRIKTSHLADGQPLELEIQAMSWEQERKTQMLVRIQLLKPSSASMPALLQLQQGKPSPTAAGLSTIQCDNAKRGLSMPGAQRYSGASTAQRLSTMSGMQRNSQMSMPLISTSGVAVDIPPEDGSADELGLEFNDQFANSPGRGNQSQSFQSQQGIDTGYNSVRLRDDTASGAKSGRWRGNFDKGQLISNGKGLDIIDDDPDEQSGYNYARKSADGFGYGGKAGDAGSVADSESIAGDDNNNQGGALDGGSIVSSAHDESLAIDTRRAVRLKKLEKVIQSDMVQEASTTWGKRTKALLAVLFLTQICCFVVLMTEVNRRYDNIRAVGDIGRGLDRYQALALRVVYLHKCTLPQFTNTSRCDAKSMNGHLSKLQALTQLAAEHHHTLYLGSAHKLKTFADQRIMDYWTYKMLPEYYYVGQYRGADGVMQDRIMTPNNTLWAIGNSVQMAAHVLIYNLGRTKSYVSLSNAATASDDYTWAQHYVIENAPEPVYWGYFWTLDTFTDFTWRDITTLSVSFIVLLIVQALIVQLACMLYEFYLLQRCNASHMRLFSVFLLLPSATVRQLARRQLQVDDDDKEVADDDALADIADAAGAGATSAAGDATLPGDATVGAAKKHKSVRMGEAVHDDADEPNAPFISTEGGLSPRKPNSKAGGKAHYRRTGIASWIYTVRKMLAFWLWPTFKCNGKELKTKPIVMMKFMVPFLAYLTAVILIYGLSFSRLRGLNSPLASLDTAAHLLFRLTRCRINAALVAYSLTKEDSHSSKADLRMELELLKSEYSALLYGGKMNLSPEANVSFEAVAPASAFIHPDVAELLFKTKNCLRNDPSGCFEDPTSMWYSITHSGLDAMMVRYFDEMHTYSKLPDALSTDTHPSYTYARDIAGNDMYEGLQTATGIFVNLMLSRLASVKELHIILLCLSVLGVVLYWLILGRPYLSLLRQHSRAVAGLLSHLPAEVDVEGAVKSVLLGIKRQPKAGFRSSQDGASQSGRHGSQDGWLNMQGGRHTSQDGFFMKTE